MNKAILMGRLTADPELKQTPNGVLVKRGTAASGLYKLRCMAKSSGDFMPIFSQGQYGSDCGKYSDRLI